MFPQHHYIILHLTANFGKKSSGGNSGKDVLQLRKKFALLTFLWVVIITIHPFHFLRFLIGWDSILSDLIAALRAATVIMEWEWHLACLINSEDGIMFFSYSGVI